MGATHKFFSWGFLDFALREYGEELSAKYKLLTHHFVLNETAICDARILSDFLAYCSYSWFNILKSFFGQQ